MNFNIAIHRWFGSITIAIASDYLCFGDSTLCRIKVLHCHVLIVFSLN